MRGSVTSRQFLWLQVWEAKRKTHGPLQEDHNSLRIQCRMPYHMCDTGESRPTNVREPGQRTKWFRWIPITRIHYDCIIQIRFNNKHSSSRCQRCNDAHIVISFCLDFVIMGFSNANDHALPATRPGLVRRELAHASPLLVRATVWWKCSPGCYINCTNREFFNL